VNVGFRDTKLQLGLQLLSLTLGPPPRHCWGKPGSAHAYKAQPSPYPPFVTSNLTSSLLNQHPQWLKQFTSVHAHVYMYEHIRVHTQVQCFFSNAFAFLVGLWLTQTNLHILLGLLCWLTHTPAPRGEPKPPGHTESHQQAMAHSLPLGLHNPNSPLKQWSLWLMTLSTRASSKERQASTWKWPCLDTLPPSHALLTSCCGN
jgi:hypothetical protein